MSLLVRSVGQMIEARSRLKLYWVHGCLLLVAFVAQVISWFSLWQFADHSPWTVAETLLLLAIPLLLYPVAHLVVPELEDGLAHDMREYYYRHARWAHGPPCTPHRPSRSWCSWLSASASSRRRSAEAAQEGKGPHSGGPSPGNPSPIEPYGL